MQPASLASSPSSATTSPHNFNTHLGQKVLPPKPASSGMPPHFPPCHSQALGGCKAPASGLAGESLCLLFLRGLLSLHLLQLAWLCLSSHSPRGLMLAVCTPPPGSCTTYYLQRYLVNPSLPYPHAPLDSTGTSLEVGQSFLCPILDLLSQEGRAYIKYTCLLKGQLRLRVILEELAPLWGTALP